MARDIVALSLFDRIDDSADLFNAGSATPTDELKKDSAVIVFCENFFLQFFQNVLGVNIKGVDKSAKRVAARKRVQLRASEDAKPTRRLIANFETLCDMWSDIRGTGYSGSRRHRSEFHRTYMPELLSSIVSWAESAGHEDLVERATESLDSYDSALANVSDEDD